MDDVFELRKSSTTEQSAAAIISAGSVDWTKIDLDSISAGSLFVNSILLASVFNTGFWFSWCHLTL